MSIGNSCQTAINVIGHISEQDRGKASILITVQSIAKASGMISSFEYLHVVVLVDVKAALAWSLTDACWDAGQGQNSHSCEHLNLAKVWDILGLADKQCFVGAKAVDIILTISSR